MLSTVCMKPSIQLVREANAGKVATRNLDLLKPEFMDQQEWKVFIKRTLSPEFQAKSAKYREMRSNQDHIHTMSRRGYARLASMMEETNTTDTPITRSKVWIEGHKKKNGQPSSQAVGEKLKKLEKCPPESLNTTNMAEDAMSLVFGNEPRGRVRGMGFGITPSKVGASMQQKATVKHLECKVHNLQMQVDEMRSMFFQNMRQQDEQEQVNSGGIGSGIGIDVDGDSTNNGKTKVKNVNRGDISENSKCKLIHWCVDGVVAEGRIASTDPNARVHHVPLGGSCWKVWIDRVFVEKVDILRPNEEMLFLEDAIGSTITWLSKYIIV